MLALALKLLSVNILSRLHIKNEEHAPICLLRIFPNGLGKCLSRMFLIMHTILQIFSIISPQNMLEKMLILAPTFYVREYTRFSSYLHMNYLDLSRRFE